MNKKLVRKTAIDAYAKVNFSIDITGVRKDGFHTVEMVMQTIPLCDSVSIMSDEQATDNVLPKLVLTCDDRALSIDKNNTALKAANMVMEHCPQIATMTDEIRIHIIKRIPVGGGLGGSSADAAGVIKGMNVHFKLGMDIEEMKAIGAQIGADVPFQIQGGTGLATGIGTEIEPLEPISKGFLLIVHPGFALTTQQVYRQYDIMKIPDDARPNTELLKKALQTGDTEIFYANMRNVLEIPAFTLRPQIGTLKELLKQTEADVVMMSGSGASVFAMYSKESAARKTAWEMESQHGCRTFICDISRLC